jgi:hypothetical protein
MSDSLPKRKKQRKLYTKPRQKKEAVAEHARKREGKVFYQTILPCFDCPWLDPNPAAKDLVHSDDLDPDACLGLLSMMLDMEQAASDFVRTQRANEY